MENRIREVAKAKGVTQVELAGRLGITPRGLSKMVTGNSLTTSTLERVASALECEVLELLPVSDNFSHFYDSESGTWLGVRKK